MAITRIASQDATGTFDGTSSATATYPATPTKGNLLIAIIATGNDGLIGLANSGWNLACSNGLGSGISMYYKVAGVSELRTITTQVDVSAGAINIDIHEYSGFSGVPTIDQVATSVNASGLTAASGTTPTTKIANELVVAAIEYDNANAISSWSNSFLTIGSISNSRSLFSAERIVSSTAAYSTVLTTTGTANISVGAIATFYGDTRATILNRGLRPHPFSPGLAR